MTNLSKISIDNIRAATEAAQQAAYKKQAEQAKLREVELCEKIKNEIEKAAADGRHEIEILVEGVSYAYREEVRLQLAVAGFNAKLTPKLDKLFVSWRKVYRNA